MGCKCHDIAKSAGSQTNSKSWKHDSMTAEFCKNFYQKIYLNNFRLEILGNKKVLEKFNIGGGRCYCSVSLLEIIFW